MSYLKIEYWNSVDLGDVYYQGGYKNKLYLDVEVERPDYNVSMEFDLNEENEEIPKFKKWEKVYKIPNVLMQEDLLDAFTFMQLHDNIEITLQTGETIFVDQLRVEYDWEEKGCLANVTVSFTEDYTIAKACSENMNDDCLCDPEVGLFIKIEEWVTLGPAGDEDIELAWTTETIAGKKYIAERYQYNTTGGLTWEELETEAGTCWENLDDSSHWYYDGTFWRIMPGYIFSITYSDPNATLKGWIPEGTFMTVYYDTGGGWIDGGTFTSADFEDIGIPVDIGSLSGTTVDFKLTVWSHGCAYGDTDTKQLIIP